MAIKTRITGSAIGTTAHVEKSGALRVALEEPDLPETGEENSYRLLSGLLGTTGLNSGTTSLNVDGSVTNVSAYVASEPDCDLHIMYIVLLIADSAVVHSSFGNVSALTNGVDLTVLEDGRTTHLISSAKTGGQLLAQAGLFVPFGEGVYVNELSNWTGTSDACIVQFPVSELIPGGIRIGKGTQNRISFIVNDNLTGLDDMTVRILGYRHYDRS